MVNVPDFRRLLAESGKMKALDELLRKLKTEGHRVLIFSQMRKMIDILEEYMHARKYKMYRLDGSTDVFARRAMVNDFQENTDTFVFLLSTRAGGLGITLTAVSILE
jgi:DNA helicase INO80